MAVNTIRFRSLFVPGADPGRDVEWRPATDIYRTPTGWLVKLELSGVRPEDVQMALAGRTLTLRGRRRDCCLEKNCQLIHMEITYSRFERLIELPGDLQSVRIETEFHDGMMLIRICREERP